MAPDDVETVSQFWEHIATNSIGIIVTMIAFWFALARNMVTKNELLNMKNDVMDIIKAHCPYVQDKPLIMERLTSNKENQALFLNMLNRNTEVMNKLELQIATLSKTLEALENRIDRHQI